MNEKHKCPDCGKEFDNPRSLGPHRRIAHGYIKPKPEKKTKFSRTGPIGHYPCALCEFTSKYQGGLARHVTAKHNPGRSTALATTTPASSEVTSTRNGHRAEADARRSLIPEAALAFTAGRVEELLSRTAAEYDVPARTFAAGVIELIYAKTLR